MEHLKVRIVHFRVHSSLFFKVRLNGKSLLRISVFIHFQTGYRDKTFAHRFAFKKRQRGARKWHIRLCRSARGWNTRLCDL